MAESEAHGGLQGILEKVEVLRALSCFLLCEIKKQSWEHNTFSKPLRKELKLKSIL